MGLDSLGSGDTAGRNLSADRLMQNLTKRGVQRKAQNQRGDAGDARGGAGGGERENEKLK